MAAATAANITAAAVVSADCTVRVAANQVVQIGMLIIIAIMINIITKIITAVTADVAAAAAAAAADVTAENNCGHCNYAAKHGQGV